LAVDSYGLLLEIDPHDIFSKDARGKAILLYKYLLQAKPVDNIKTDEGSFSEEDQGEAEMDCD
jgi:hypothetical protein